jgi:hypothetical protein
MVVPHARKPTKAACRFNVHRIENVNRRGINVPDESLATRNKKELVQSSVSVPGLMGEDGFLAAE